MGVFEGKSQSERIKIIAAIILGTLAVISLIYTFGGLLIGGKKTTVAVDVDGSPTATVTPGTSQTNNTQVSIPNEEQINSDYLVTPVIYNPNIELGGIGGRNIFAFYEPPPPTPVPPRTPTPPPTPPTPDPLPQATPFPIALTYITPQSTYAGSKTFRLEVVGDKFTPEAKIVFNGTPLQTVFVTEQKLYADVPASLISSPGFGQVRVDRFDGKNYSDQLSFNIQAPPRPTVEYIGMIARKHYNNDTAYFQKKGDEDPVAKRLNDIVDDRFKLVSISEREVELIDTRLGFRYKLPLLRPDPGSSSGSDTFTRPTIPNNRTIRQSIPGIPDNIPRATPLPRPNIPNPTSRENSNVKRP